MMDKLINEVIIRENIDVELYYVATIDGSKCVTLKKFASNISTAFKFPSNYGKNLNAIEEALNDLEWLNKPNYLLIVKNSKDLLIEESKNLREDMIRFLENISIQWANVPNYDGEEIYRNRADFRIKML